MNKIEISIALAALIIWVIIVANTKSWLGTKIGDVFVTVLAMCSLYGFICAIDGLYKWIIK